MTPAIALAAIDLGSNSFRLEIGSYEHQQIHRVEYLKETMRQGSGLDAQRNLSQAAMERGWECLARFGERLRGFDPQYVRVVATQTLREARNREVFVRRGSELLGFPIEVISGEEEAALIYRGVVSQLPDADERRLVMDIGGRSTELVLGRGHLAQSVASFRVGSVAWTSRYFPDGQLHTAAFEAAKVAALAVLDAALDTFCPGSWDIAYASAGTANAVGDILLANGQSQGIITRHNLGWLQEQLLRAGHVDRLELAGLRDDRRPVMAGGLSVLRAAFELLGLEQMHIAQGALRMGVLHSLLDQHWPPSSQDVCTTSMQGLMQRFGVDHAHAMAVRDTADHLWHQLHSAAAAAPDSLHRAACLHELGCAISRSDFHRHSAYIVEHSQPAGFEAAQLQAICQLLQWLRGPLPPAASWTPSPTEWNRLLCLRLAVVLCHARQCPDLQGLQLQRHAQGWQLQLPAAWCQHHPRSVQLLQAEVQAFANTPKPLTLQIA